MININGKELNKLKLKDIEKFLLYVEDDETLDKLEQNKYLKVNDDEFLSFSPQTTGFALLVPKEEIGGVEDGII